MKTATGVYETTNAFRQIEAHCAVVDAETFGLIATTGPYDDPDSRRFAILFAAVPDLLTELQAIVAVCQHTAALLRKELAPITHEGQALLFESLAERGRKVIAKVLKEGTTV